MKKMQDLLRGRGLDGVVRSMQEVGSDSPLYREMVRESVEVWRAFRRSHGYTTMAKLFTYPESQHKLALSEVYSIGLTLQHATVAGVEMCPWRTRGCTATCVLDNGGGRYSSTQKARNVKTWFLMEHPHEFMVLLFHELTQVSAKHERVLVRMNVNSDLPWHDLAPHLFTGVWSNVYFYDYTKNPWVLTTDGWVADRYRLVFSLSERVRTDAQMQEVYDFVDSGGTVAVVTIRRKGEPVAESVFGRRVYDGDVTDNRYDESHGFVDLTAKGKARSLKVGGFVRDLSVL